MIRNPRLDPKPGDALTRGSNVVWRVIAIIREGARTSVKLYSDQAFPRGKTVGLQRFRAMFKEAFLVEIAKEEKVGS